MREKLQKRCELFVRNRDLIKTACKWENSYMYPLCASIFAEKNQLVDINQLTMCRKLVKENTSIFSNFRGIPLMATVSMLAQNPNPQMRFERIQKIYGMLKKEFFGSEYLTIAASVISDDESNGRSETEDEKIVQKTRAIYNEMKHAHPFHTSGEDSTFAAMLALSELSVEQISVEMERCYGILKPNFLSGNAVQALSHVLTLGEGSAETKSQKVMDIYETLKSKGHKYGTSYELATLGVLALLDVDVETLTQDMIEVDRYLKTQKGFGAFGIGAKQRLMYAGILTMMDYVEDTKVMHTASLQSVVTLVIAQQVAICAAAAASSAAASSASS